MNTKKLLSTTALVLTLAFSSMAYADKDWHSQERHDGKSSFADVLPKDKADQFHAIMSKAHEKNLALLDQLHKLREERRAILTAAKFDKDAFVAKSEELTKFRETMHEKMRANMKEAFANAAGNLSQEEREALAASMESYRHAHHHYGEKMEGDANRHMGHTHDEAEKHMSSIASPDLSDK